jgi:hypothetical protein
MAFSFMYAVEKLPVNIKRLRSANRAFLHAFVDKSRY